MSETKSFEASLTALEKAVDNLESGDLSLEESLKCFEQGVKMATRCQKYLNDVETRVEILLKEKDGSLSVVEDAGDE